MSTKEIESVELEFESGLDIREPRVYEIGYILNPNIQETDLDGEVDAIRKTVTDNGGLPISEGKPELIDLAYTMDAVINNERNIFSKGYFGWIKFDVPPDKVAVIKELLDTNASVIRSLLSKTVREAVVVRPRFTPEKVTIEPKPSASPIRKEEQPAEPINEAELDKQIDELVVDNEGTSKETKIDEPSEKSE
jgi:ribosomal protein S6